MPPARHRIHLRPGIGIDRVMVVMIMVVRVVAMSIGVIVMVTVIGMAVVCHRAILVLHAAIRQVGVIVAVAVDRKCPAGRTAKQTHIFRAARDGIRCSPAADMAVEAYDRVGLGHHDMEIVGNQQNAATRAIPDRGNQIVERDLPTEIDALDRFVQHQEIRLSRDRPRQERPLEFPPERC